ncbi:MAG: hypothetical protein LBM94_02150 [Propionibacteriaceae bacterium]|jgi:hypothetical protein|nr:hypothetical protein [Propionibacteriaceae bacterium]
MTDPSARLPGQRFRNPPNAAAPVPDQVESQLTRKASSTAVAPTIQRYRTTRPVVAILAGLAAIALVASVIWVGTRPDPNVTPPTPTPSPAETDSGKHTPSPGGQGVEFESSLDDATGYWEIISYSWDASGTTVSIKMRITLDEGASFSWSFFALDNAAADIFYPVSDSGFDEGRLYTGESVTGTVKFRLPKADSTIYLANRNERQLAALVIKA